MSSDEFTPTPEELAEVARLEEQGWEELTIEEAQERSAAWDEFRGKGVDLMSVDTESPVRWVPGAEGIVRAGERQSWVASYGEGKTQAAMNLAAQVCKAGGRVIYLDVENDTREMAERLKPIVASFGDCGTRERLAYRTDPDLLTDRAKMRELIEALGRADLFIIDSFTRVLAALGIDEADNKGVAEFTTGFVDAIKHQSGVAVLILDNTGHEHQTRARGAVSKAALVEAVYAVTGGTEISESKHGTLRLTLTRSRSGKLAPSVMAGAGGGEYGPLEPHAARVPIGLEERIIAAVGEVMKTSDIAKAVKDSPRSKSFKEALAAAVKTGYIVCVRKGYYGPG